MNMATIINLSIFDSLKFEIINDVIYVVYNLTIFSNLMKANINALVAIILSDINICMRYIHRRARKIL